MSDSTQHQAALDGLEEISSVIAKYIAIEDIYVQSYRDEPDSPRNDVFQTSILRVYSSVLLYQVKAALHFHRSTMARTVSNLLKSTDWNDLISTVKQTDLDCVALTSMTAAANMSSNIALVNKGIMRIDEKWSEISHIDETLDKLQKSFEDRQKVNADIMSWVSDIQVGDDHERVRTKLGSRYWATGQWFLHNSSFRLWRTSPRGQFWLQGSVGTGKTSLASIVINELIKSGKHPNIAFFYCSRGLAASSNSPTTIFRSLVAQLAATADGERIYLAVLNRWKLEAKKYTTGCRLNLTECEELLITLMKERGSTVIIVDGVDECSEPMQLLRALHTIWKGFPRLKILVTSRLDVAVTEVFSRITTVRSDFSKTSDDIKEYIQKELERKERRNAKVISDELADRMVKILTERAQGM